MENTTKLVLFAIVSVTVSEVNSTLNLAFANNKGIQFEISDCPVQRTSTTEKSGPCPDRGTESKTDSSHENSLVKSVSGTKVDKKSETTPIHSISPASFESVDPFSSTTK